MSRHTPGPWEMCTGSHGDACVCGLVWARAADRVVATVNVERCPVLDHGHGSPPDDASKANARLVAAAPDLLAACEAVLATPVAEYAPKMLPPQRDAFATAAAAVAKAKGV